MAVPLNLPEIKSLCLMSMLSILNTLLPTDSLMSSDQKIKGSDLLVEVKSAMLSNGCRSVPTSWLTNTWRRGVVSWIFICTSFLQAWFLTHDFQYVIHLYYVLDTILYINTCSYLYITLTYIVPITVPTPQRSKARVPDLSSLLPNVAGWGGRGGTSYLKIIVIISLFCMIYVWKSCSDSGWEAARYCQVRLLVLVLWIRNDFNVDSYPAF